MAYIENKVFSDPNLVVGPTIKNFAAIWAGASILPGIPVGEYSIVGSNAVVNKDVDHHTLVVGVPAKVIKQFNN